jgi:radical SAM protein with 4Fe4S-binding SPASM domain
MLDKFVNAGLHPPRELTFAITKDCNLECGHCWPNYSGETESGHIPLEVFRRTILDFIAYGLEKVIITGGDPLLHPDWFSIARYSCGEQRIKEVCIQTNATLIDSHIIDLLLSPGMEKISVQVSLDGGTAKTNDIVRGEGTFKKALRGLRLLADSGLRTRVSINFTEFRHNYEEIPFVLGLLKNLGIPKFTSSTLVKSGRAAGSKMLKLPEPKQYLSIIGLYNSNSRFKMIYDEIGNIAAIEWYKGRGSPGRKGCDLVKKPYISADLKLFPCVFLPVDKYAASLIEIPDINEIFSVYIPLWAELQKLSLERPETLTECSACPGARHCASGCMGRAIALKGDPLSTEDRCSLRKAIYSGFLNKGPIKN